MQEISCPPFFIYKKILISTLVFFISVTSLEGYAASNLEENNNNTFSASGNTSESFQYPSLSNIIKIHLPTLSKAKVSFPGASDREIAVAGPTISLIGNVQPRELILRNSESSLFAFPSFFSLQISKYKMPRLAEIELLPIKKYASFALGTNTVQAAEELSDKNAALPFLDRLSLSIYCAFAPRGEIIDSRRCDYQALVSGRLDSVPDLATNVDPSPAEEELPTPTEVATTTPPTPSSSSPIYLTRYITQYIGVPGPAGKDGADGKDGVNGISSAIPPGYGSYIIPSYSSPSTSIGVSTISYLRQTTIELPVITGGSATNLSLITPTVSGGVFSGLSLFNDSANFTGSVNINNLTATSSTVTNLTSTNATTTDLFSTNGTFTNLFATNATTTNAYIDFLTVGSSTAGSLTLSGTLNVAGTSTLATTTASSLTAANATTTNLFTQNLSVGNASTTGNQSIDGQFNVSGTSTLGANVFLNGSVVVGTSTDELFTVNALINSNLTPSQNITYDLGSPSFYWRNLYANNINVNSISAASTTISGTSNNDFVVNSDNVSTDAEDASFVFFRGLSTPNALLRWNSATKRIESNMSFKIQNETPTTGTTTLTVQSGAGQGSTNLFELLSNAGTKLSAFTKDGWLGIGTTTPESALTVVGSTTLATTTVSQLTSTFTGTSTFAGNLSVAGNFNFNGALLQNGAPFVGSQWTTAGSNIYYSTGNVGIGTSTPTSALSVVGSVSLANLGTSADNSYYSVLFQKTDGELLTDSFLSYNPAADTLRVGNGNLLLTGSTISASGSNDFALGVANSFPNITISGTTGNVGIGTTTPSTRLNVVGTTTLVGSSASPTALRVIGNINNVLDSSVPPALVGTITTGLQPRAISVVGKYAYVINAGSSTLQIFDVSNPLNPVIIGATSTGSEPRGLVVSGRYAYVANRTSDTLQVFDVNNPALPTSVSTLSIGASSRPTSIALSGKYLYVVNNASSTFQVIDASNPTSLAVVSTISTGSNPSSVTVSGQYAYVVNVSSSNLQIINITNPLTPVVSGTISTGISFPQSVTVSGRYAYITNSGSDRLSIIDISNSTSPSVASTTITGSFPAGVAVSGRYTYVTNYSAASLQVFDTSSSTNPVVVSTVTTGSNPWAVSVSGRYMYVINYGSGSLQIFDIGGMESTSAIIHSLTAGNLSVNNDIFANGNIVTNGSLTAANGFQSQANSSVYGSFSVGTPNSVPQLRLSKTSSVYADLTLDSGGDLTFNTTGYNVKAMSNNLYICDNAGCPGFTATSTAGNIFVENATVFGNNFSINQTSSTSLGMFDHSGILIMTFDEAP